MRDLIWARDDWNTIIMWFALGLFAAAIITVIILSATKKAKLLTTRETALAGICLALSFALSYITVFNLPQGGSVTAASMLPLLVYVYFFGWKKGLIVGLVYSLLQIIQNPQIYNPIQVLLDYPLAFGSIAIVGAFKRIGIKGFYIGSVIFAIVRTFMHFLAGVVFFYEFATFQPVWLYSLAYNSFVLVDMGIALVVSILMFSSKNFKTAMERLSSDGKQFLFEIKKNKENKDINIE